MSECAQSAFSWFQSVIDLHFSTVFKIQTHTINYKNYVHKKKCYAFSCNYTKQ